MAFSDIKRWADILNESIEEAAEWDKACDEANAEIEALRQKEFDDIDEDPVDADALGMSTPTERHTDTLKEISDENDKIDFEAYLKALDEADDREVLSHGLDIVGVKASTANLAAQDTVQLKLAEAIETLSKVLSKKNSEVDSNFELKSNLTEEDEQIRKTAEEMVAESDGNLKSTTGMTDEEYDELLSLDQKDAIKFLTTKLNSTTDTDEKHALEQLIAAYDYDTSRIAKSGFAPATKEFVDHIDDKKLRRLLAKGNELVAKRDSVGLSDDEQDELTDVITRLRELEAGISSPWTFSKFNPADGTTEYFHDRIPGFNSDNTGMPKINDRKRMKKAEVQKIIDYKHAHPDVPERGKDEWTLADDWNGKIMSNLFSPKEFKEFYKHMIDGATPQEKAVINHLFDKDNQRDIAAAWGVSHTAVSAMETKVMNALIAAIAKTGKLRSDALNRFARQSLIDQKKLFGSILERFLERASDRDIEIVKQHMANWASHRNNTKFNPKKNVVDTAADDTTDEQNI